MANLLEMYLANPENAAKSNPFEEMMKFQAEVSANPESVDVHNKQIEMLNNNVEKTPGGSERGMLESALEKAKQQGDQDAARYYRHELSKLPEGKLKGELPNGLENLPHKKGGMKIVLGAPSKGYQVSFKGTPARSVSAMARVNSTPAVVHSTPARGADAMARVNTTPAVVHSTDA